MNVLWIRYGAFGDVLKAVARARLFKRKFPEAELTMLSRPEYKNILSVQDVFKDCIFWDSKRNPIGFINTIREIRNRKYDMLVSVHNVGASALVSVMSGIPERYGVSSALQFCYHKNVWDWFREAGIDENMRDVPMIQTDERSMEFADDLLSGLPESKVFCIIGASKPQKLWSIEYWVKFIRKLSAQGRGIVINGHGREEAGYAEFILKEVDCKNILNLVNRIDFLQMAAVVKKCAIAVGPDTGPLHLAALCGTPTLGLFGCTPSQRIGFTMPWFREVTCSCPKIGCWNYKCPEGDKCMSTLTPEMAIEGFEQLTKMEIGKWKMEN
ncbi:MAG: glycosyltransferase family 9 protein [Synergistaceae bacterium]|nr:glycosyltransferase family 9 protein [Synergistaceae bacterium]